ncbi:DPP IV N-terminal domain-containing protein [Flavitalea sp. BT771]|uniref:S9 family peptidase n=1 Tax=Flavitalea sp. BT771 TaxID=3063329 RepID=UPI0026E13FA4|nr:DPP IV N-terminal domain-containing protein [Flavitalea sp. BT771]MDO6433812.1 DPP IV N-terminal domain-containing protein [Flavitalea sp. BT771]MDV6222283.1 DPP IV N-terminal domain-containing protein [Flavitalea sp. BT771]
MFRILLTFLLLVTCYFVRAQLTPVIKANYQAAARFSPRKLDKLVFSTSVDPHWLKKSDRFWYVYETSEGKKWYIIDPVRGEKKQLFDNEKLAAAITRIVHDPFDAQHLGLDSMRFIKDENWIQFEVKSTSDAEKTDSSGKKTDSVRKKEKKVFYFEYHLLDGTLNELVGYKKPKHKPNWASISPDSNTIVFGRRFNLYWMDKANYEKALRNEDDSTIVEHALTTDGVEYFSYHGSGVLGGGGETNVDKEKNKDKRKPAQVFWSPDAKYFAMTRSDSRKVKDLWVINALANPRPTLESYKYQMPGEKEAPVDHVLLFDMTAMTHRELNAAGFKDQDVALWAKPVLAKNRDDEYRSNIWLGTDSKFYFSRTSRDLKRIDVCTADVKDTVARPLIREGLNTYVEIHRPGLINEGKELIEWSERDGWAHFYLYDANGKLENQITSGSFHCEDIVGIDEKKRILYFSANGREAGEDPYYLHLYKVNFDGSGFTLLDPGEFDHAINMNDDQQFFVDNYSRVNTAPRSALFNALGKKIMDLEATDLSALMAAGYKFPQPFKVKADDGITDIYGVMYKPFNFDSTKKYPIMEYVYPGPQTEAVNKAFSRSMDRTERLAQLGMIVITLGNRGGHPSRSKWYHNYGYGNLRDYGLADKKAAVEQLADRYPFIDVNRVGIHGHSGGGFMSTAAMLVYPDFFKVAVSSSGNHDNAIYNRWWSEKHHGVKEVISPKGDTTFVYNIEKNPDLAKNLKGHLMLSTGDIDNNVHPGNTIRVANALIKANKRFDLVLLPGQRHGYADMTEYFFWRMADYFSHWLIGDVSERPVDMEEIDREQPQIGEKEGNNRTPDEDEEEDVDQ